MFQALCNRRNVRLKYERYANALTAAAVYNVHRGSTEDPLVRPFDFVMDDEQSTRREQRIKFTTYVQKAIGHLPPSTPMSKIQETRSKVIRDLEASGCPEPEKFFNSIWPHLQPAGENSN